MIRPSRISPDVLINESLGAADLASSPMCANGMKLLIYARDNEGITLTKSGGFFRKFVTWAAYEFQWPEHEPEKLFSVNKAYAKGDGWSLGFANGASVEVGDDGKVRASGKGAETMSRLLDLSARGAAPTLWHALRPP